MLMMEVERAQVWRKRSLRPSKRRLPQGLLGKVNGTGPPGRRVGHVACYDNEETA